MAEVGFCDSQRHKTLFVPLRFGVEKKTTTKKQINFSTHGILFCELMFFVYFLVDLSVLATLCLWRPFCIFDKCLYLNPESCRSKQARYPLSHPSPYLATPLPT
jgi:hypothetical protein